MCSVGFPLVRLGVDARRGDLRSRAATPLDLEIFLRKLKVFTENNFDRSLPKYINREKSKTKQEKKRENN